MPRQYYVYILASRSRTLYVGVTNDLLKRVEEHRAGMSEFTRRYRIFRLVYVELTADVAAAIRREKQLERMNRAKKGKLVADLNPDWTDLLPTFRPEGSARRHEAVRSRERTDSRGADPSLRSG